MGGGNGGCGGEEEVNMGWGEGCKGGVVKLPYIELLGRQEDRVC